MKVFALMLLYLLGYLDILGTQGTGLPKSVEDYYWKDYNGLIPNTALPGGKDEDGATTYLAQLTTVAEYNLGTAALHTIPAVIKLGSQYAVAAYNGHVLKSNAATNTKILCFGYKASSYSWKSPTQIFPPNCRFVVAGYEDDTPMYIGLATENNETVVGKVFSDTTNHHAGLISPYKGGILYHNNYTVLTYCI